MSWDLDSIGDQTGKRVLVTGANSGIGFEAAQALAGKGAEVILACRNQSKGEAALAAIRQTYPSSQVSLMSLDLSSLGLWWSLPMPSRPATTVWMFLSIMPE